MFIFLCLFILIPLARSGLKYVFRGLNHLFRFSSPPNAPRAFRNYNEVFKTFVNQALPTYHPMNEFVHSIFGKNSRFLSPVRRIIVLKNSHRLKKRIRSFIIAAALCGFVLWFFSWVSTPEARKAITSITGPKFVSFLSSEIASELIPLPFIWWPVWHVVLAIVEFSSSYLLIPRRQPTTEPLQATEYYRGFGHPVDILNRLPDVAHELQWQDFPHRIHKSDIREQVSRAVGDTGVFQGSVFIEQQPQPVKTPGFLTAYVLLAAGWWMLMASGYAVLFKWLPFYIRDLAVVEAHGLDFIWTLMFMAALLWLVRSFIQNGRHFMTQADQLAESVWFRSTAVLIHLDGHMSRADIRVGRGVYDAIESSNVIVRSDFAAHFWTAEMLSEARDIHETRDLMGLHQTPQSQAWLDFFPRELHQLREEGVTPVGVDFSAHEVAEIVQSNIGVFGLQGDSARQVSIETASDADTYGRAYQLQESQDRVSCPDCAELVKEKAKKCRYCGYRFH